MSAGLRVQPPHAPIPAGDAGLHLPLGGVARQRLAERGEGAQLRALVHAFARRIIGDPIARLDALDGLVPAMREHGEAVL